MADAGFRQLLLWRWRADIPPERRRQVLAALPAPVDDLVAVDIGQSCRPDGAWDAVAVMDFVDEDWWRRYLEHPAHRSFVADHSMPSRSAPSSTATSPTGPTTTGPPPKRRGGSARDHRRTAG